MIKNSKLLILVLVIIIISLGWLFIKSKNYQQKISQQPPNKETANQDDNNPRLLSTKPDPLEGALISADEIIELRFNKPLENGPELKLKIEPEIKFETKLSSDKKTAKIYPQRPYDLGMTYTLFLSTEAKFEGGGKLKGEFFHFHTIKYRGI